MLGMGPILWAKANLEMHGKATASGRSPVDRLQASIVADPFTTIPKYRYESPAAWRYYQMIDAITSRENDHV